MILELTCIGFVLGWRFLIVLGRTFISIVVLAWLMNSAFTASEAVSVLEGVFGIVEVGVDLCDGGARIGLVPEVEAVRESMETEGDIWLTALGLGFNTTLDLYK
jgi:hypothetical protein